MTHIDPLIPSAWHLCLSALPGWWFGAGDDDVIRVRRAGRGRFLATVYPAPRRRWIVNLNGPNPFELPPQGRAVLGVYPTVVEARDAALAKVGTGPTRIATWRDVVEARKAKAQAESNSA